MNLLKLSLISIILFIIGIIIQIIDVSSGITLYNLAYIYIPLYLSGIISMPVGIIFNKIKSKLKNK